MKIIAISGTAQSGKDTAAAMMKLSLENRGKSVLITHYADLLKYICRTFLGWNGEKDLYGRSLLQNVGTEVFRDTVGKDFWVDFIITILKAFPDKWDYVLIPDARFPNEINRLTEEGFDVTYIRVMRSAAESLTKEQQTHRSETSMNELIPDFSIYNDGSIDDLQETIDYLAEGEFH